MWILGLKGLTIYEEPNPPPPPTHGKICCFFFVSASRYRTVKLLYPILSAYIPAANKYQHSLSLIK